MASLASLVNLGSLNMISLGNFDGSVCIVSRRLTFPRDSISSRRFWSGKRLKYVGVCSNSLTTNYSERENSLSLDSTRRGSSKDNDTDRFFTADPNPALESGPEIDSLRSTLWGELEVHKEDEISEVIESPGEILERAEKLETSKKVHNVSVNNKRLPNETTNQKDGRAVVTSVENSNRNLKTSKNGITFVNVVENSDRKSKPVKTLKSVWRKGNPEATITMQKIVRKPQKQKPPVRPPKEIQPKLQSMPSVPPPPPPSIQKSVISELQSKPVVGSETGLAPETKEHKMTLLDHIRKGKVAAGEAGGITQGIGACKVQAPIDGKKQACVFIDAMKKMLTVSEDIQEN